MAIKKYQIKAYDKIGTYKNTISPKIVMSDIIFSSNINWWQWELILNLNLNFNDTTYIEWDIIKVTEYDENNTSWILLYNGFVSKINRLINTGSEYISLVCIWIHWLLNNIIFYDTSYTPTLNQDPAQSIKDVIDYFNTQYWWTLISYSWGNIDNYGSSINIAFDYDTCYEAITKIVEATDFWWYIDQDWQVYFKEKPSSATYNITNKKDVESIDVQEDMESLVNKLFLERSGGTIKTYEDSTSQTTYWIKELFLSQTDLQDEASQDIFWADYISENKNTKKNTSIILNSKYNLEQLKPWDTLKLLNIDYTLDNVQVLQTNYTPDNMSLEIEKLVTFGKEVVISN